MITPKQQRYREALLKFPPGPERQRALDVLIAAEKAGPSAATLIKRGWRAWYAHLFGQSFVDVLDSAETDDKHHSEAIEWHWEARLALLRGARPPHDWFAYFPTWPRGGMKSTVAERMVVTDAALSLHFKQPGFALYIGREKTKIQESIGNIEMLLSIPTVQALFPQLSKVKRNEETNQKRQWTGTYIHTAADYVVKGGTIESAQAGARVGETRPTFMVPDDIDSRDDSPVMSASIVRALTTEILPMRQANTLTFWAQNLIGRHTARYMIETQQVRAMTNRKPAVRVPAVRNMVTEPRTVDGFVRDIMIAGQSSWRGWNHLRIQDEINAMGLPAFLRECQHEVESDRAGLVMQNWNDRVHVISRSMFAAKFGTRELPQRWFKYLANDWARTKTQYHANVGITLTVSSQNTMLPGCVFAWNPVSFVAGAAPEDVAERLLTGISPLVRVGQTLRTWREMIRMTVGKLGLEAMGLPTQDLITQRRALLAKVIPDLAHPILSAQNYRTFRVSHERKDVRKVYREVFGLPAQACNPGMDGGVDSLNLLMAIDFDQPHPFRQGENGFSNFYLVCEDDVSRPLVIDLAPVTYDGGKVVYEPLPFRVEAMRPDDLHDDQLFRYQMAHCRYRDPWLTSAGEKEGDILKMNDDFVNALMFLAYDGLLSPAPLTHAEQINAAIPEKYQYDKLLAQNNGKGLTPEQELSYVFQLERAKKAVGPAVAEFDEWLSPLSGEDDEE